MTELGTRENKPRTNAPRTLTKRPPARARTRFHIGRRIVPYLWSPAGATCVAASSRVEPDRRPRQPRRGLHQPEHPPGVLRGAPPPRRLARRGGERAPAVRGAAPVRGSGRLARRVEPDRVKGLHSRVRGAERGRPRGGRPDTRSRRPGPASRRSVSGRCSAGPRPGSPTVRRSGLAWPAGRRGERDARKAEHLARGRDRRGGR